MALKIRAEQPRDFAAIDRVLRDAFGQEGEAQLVKALRGDGDLALSLVADRDGAILGHVAFEPIAILPAAEFICWAMAPVAVTPRRQRQGIGKALVEEGLKQAAARNVGFVAVLGDPNYYRRFGFRPDIAGSLDVPWAGPHFMGLTLGSKPPPRGKAIYPAAFGALES